MEEQTEHSKLTPIEFVKEKLGQNPEAPFAEIKAQGKLAGLTIYPVVFGRAKALLGLVPMAPYGSKSKARRKKRQLRLASEDGGGGLGIPSNGGRSSRGSDGDPLSSLETLVGDLTSAVQERDRYRTVLEKVVRLLQAELGRDG